MSTRRKLTALAASTLAFGGVALVGAGPASANATELFMCSVDNSQSEQFCAYAQNLVSGDQVTAKVRGDDNSFWYIPTNGWGQISLATGSTKLCMEWDEGDNNAIILAACTGKAAEEWSEAVDGNGDFTYYNEYMTNYCINFDKYNDTLNAIASCSSPGVDQQWITPAP
jgi:hypothetical protein